MVSVAYIVPVSRYSACEIVWHSGDQPLGQYTE